MEVRPSQKIAQLLKNKSLDYIFIPTCRELQYFCGLWFVTRARKRAV